MTRDGAVLLGKLAIAAYDAARKSGHPPPPGDLDTAAEALRPVVAADPADADAQYDLALIAERKGDYNRARQGYLAALLADPRYANARINLVFLTLKHGSVDEARHHAERYAATFPGDPTGASLAQVVAAAAPR